MEQFAKDLQAILAAAVGTYANVYERQAPRYDNGQLSVSPPFAVYTCDMRGAQDEGGEQQGDLFIDVWALDSWEDCYGVMAMIDEALEGMARKVGSGTICTDRNGAVFQRMERDPDDERIRRMSGQYLVRFNKEID